MIRGRGQLVTTTTGIGRAVDMVTATGGAIGGIPPSNASSSKPIVGNAFRTREVNMNKYFTVLPREPQQLLWLTPQYGIDYHIIANSNWKII